MKASRDIYLKVMQKKSTMSIFTKKFLTDAWFYDEV